MVTIQDKWMIKPDSQAWATAVLWLPGHYFMSVQCPQLGEVHFRFMQSAFKWTRCPKFWTWGFQTEMTTLSICNVFFFFFCKEILILFLETLCWNLASCLQLHTSPFHTHTQWQQQTEAGGDSNWCDHNFLQNAAEAFTLHWRGIRAIIRLKTVEVILV